jgi:hypothetical protein
MGIEELEILIDPMAHGWTGVATGAYPGYLYSYMLLGRLQDLGNMRFDGMVETSFMILKVC